MKRCLLMIVMIAICLPVTFAQRKELNMLFDKYEKKKSVESISVAPSLLISMSGKDVNKQVEKQINSLSNIRILNVPSSLKENGKLVSESLKKEFTLFVEEYKFNRLAKMIDDGEVFELYVNKEANGALLFMNDGSDELTIIALIGDIDEEIINAVMKGSIKISTK